jgi:hypothetical protein
VAIDVSSTFVPGPKDRRALGVVVENVTIEPVDAGWRPTARVTWLLALSTMASVAVAIACGFTVPWTIVAGAVVGAAGTWLLVLDGAFLGSYIDRLVRIAAGTAAAGLAIMLARLRWPHPSAAPEWSTAIGVTVLAAALKIAFFGHPNVALADSIFQVHRAQYVEAGRYFFTSVTPRPFFEFPYAIALYVAAMPLWDLFPSELDRVRLLRGLSIAADSLVAVAMYFALRCAWNQRAIALAFVALWPFARSPLSALCTANLTNLFGQGIFGAAMGLVGWMAVTGHVSTLALGGLTVLLSVAFLSHFSTVSVGVPLAGLVGVMLLGVGGGRRRLGVWVLAAVFAAAAVSYVAYYSRFHAVYRSTLERVVSRDGATEERSMAAPVAVKADRWQRLLRADFGWPVLVAAAGGALWLFVRRRTPMALVLGGWGVAWALFALLAIFTPVEMRANLAGAPFVLAVAACGLGAMGGSSGWRAAAAVAAGLVIAWDGFTRWMHCLTG